MHLYFVLADEIAPYCIFISKHLLQNKSELIETM